jgi:hypothetical protein
VSQELCKVAELKPFMLNHPKLTFFKRLVEKLGGTHFTISCLLAKYRILRLEEYTHQNLNVLASQIEKTNNIIYNFHRLLPPGNREDPTDSRGTQKGGGSALLRGLGC